MIFLDQWDNMRLPSAISISENTSSRQFVNRNSPKEKEAEVTQMSE
jgi:hypothetical protein